MRTLHPWSVPYRSFSRSVNLGFLFFLFGVFASPGAGGANVASVLGTVAVGVVVAVLYEVAYYRRFRYELTGDTFDVVSGVFSRRDREVPLRRVQNVDVRQNVLQRPAGIAAVHVETAGGGQTEITLRYVAEAEARRLQRQLRRGPATGDAARSTDERGAADRPAASADTGDGGASRARTAGASRDESTSDAERFGETTGEPDEELLFEIDRSELAILSVFTIDPGASLLATIALSFASGFDPTTLVPIDALDRGLPGTGLAVLAWVGFLFVLVAWVVSALLTFSRYYGFRLVRIGDELHYERGLLQRYSGQIPLDKVQTLSITESIPYRWFGYGSLAVETAGYAPGQSGSRGQESAIPLAGRDRVYALARSIEPFESIPLEPIPRRARERYAIRYLAVVAVAIALGYAIANVFEPFDEWYAVGAAAILAPVAAHLKWRSRGYADGERYFHTRSGFWRRTTKIVPYYRTQAVIDSRTIFQRRRRLATVVADTASSDSLFGRTATAFDVDGDRATELRRTIERRLQEQLRERDTGTGDGDRPDFDPRNGSRGEAGDGSDGDAGDGSEGDATDWSDGEAGVRTDDVGGDGPAGEAAADSDGDSESTGTGDDEHS